MAENQDPELELWERRAPRFKEWDGKRIQAGREQMNASSTTGNDAQNQTQIPAQDGEIVHDPPENQQPTATSSSPSSPSPSPPSPSSKIVWFLRSLVCLHFWLLRFLLWLCRSITCVVPFIVVASAAAVVLLVVLLATLRVFAMNMGSGLLEGIEEQVCTVPSPLYPHPNPRAWLSSPAANLPAGERDRNLDLDLEPDQMHGRLLPGLDTQGLLCRANSLHTLIDMLRGGGGQSYLPKPDKVRRLAGNLARLQDLEHYGIRNASALRQRSADLAMQYQAARLVAEGRPGDDNYNDNNNGHGQGNKHGRSVLLLRRVLSQLGLVDCRRIGAQRVQDIQHQAKLAFGEAESTASSITSSAVATLVDLRDGVLPICAPWDLIALGRARTWYEVKAVLKRQHGEVASTPDGSSDNHGVPNYLEDPSLAAQDDAFASAMNLCIDLRSALAQCEVAYKSGTKATEANEGQGDWDINYEKSMWLWCLQEQGGGTGVVGLLRDTVRTLAVANMKMKLASGARPGEL